MVRRLYPDLEVRRLSPLHSAALVDDAILLSAALCLKLIVTAFTFSSDREVFPYFSFEGTRHDSLFIARDPQIAPRRQVTTTRRLVGLLIKSRTPANES
jgi:hypothetical protein